LKTEILGGVSGSNEPIIKGSPSKTQMVFAGYRKLTEKIFFLLCGENNFCPGQKTPKKQRFEE
jgi:hypothetical protein